MHEDDFEDLSSAEDFLEYFDVPFDPKVVHVNRLHILQRFHDYLGNVAMPEDQDAQRVLYTDCLKRAYDDFVRSDALTEKVFAVFHQQAGGEVAPAFVPADSLLK